MKIELIGMANNSILIWIKVGCPENLNKTRILLFCRDHSNFELQRTHDDFDFGYINQNMSTRIKKLIRRGDLYTCHMGKRG